MQRLRLDRRLLRRPGWITAAEVESELEALPDNAHKATTLGAVEDEAKGEEPSPAE
ncbi:MAG: hypothetical protein ACQGVC_01345 [Myxococcota bacterium]